MVANSKTSLSIPTSILYRGKKVRLNLNEYRNWHYRVSNIYKKSFKALVSESIESLLFTKQIKIEYTYYAPDARKRDLMNVIAVVDKFFQDALVENGCMDSDDTDTVVAVSSLYGGIDRGNSRIDVTIIPLND